MSILFGSSSDQVRCGNGSTINNLDPFTVVQWIYPTSNLNSRPMWQKGRIGGHGKQFQMFNTNGQIQCKVSRNAGANPSQFTTTANTMSTSNVWYYVAWTFDSTAPGGITNRLYVGSLTTIAASEAGTDLTGSGTVDDDSGASDPMVIGNAPALTAPFPGRIAVSAYIAASWSLAEIQAWQFNPRMTANMRSFHVLGFNGTGTQPDWSGNGNASTTVTGSVAAHVPLPSPFGFSAEDLYVVAAAGGQSTPELYGPSGLYATRQLHQLLAQ